MNLDSASHRGAIESALLDCHRSPGKYALSRKQPHVLFSAVKEVMQLASGRSPEGDAAAAPSQEVQEAACFFIRSALLYPDADHYALLGLPNGADAAAVKDRYRLMMRLMHPDFAGADSRMTWPADAATRVNQAYEILSAPARRAAYDEQLAPAQPPRQPAAQKSASGGKLVVSPRGAASKAVAEDPRRRLKRLALAFGTAGGLGLLAIGLSGSERESLVQRARAPLLETPQARPIAIAPMPEPVAIALPTAPFRAPAIPAPAPMLEVHRAAPIHALATVAPQPVSRPSEIAPSATPALPVREPIAASVAPIVTTPVVATPPAPIVIVSAPQTAAPAAAVAPPAQPSRPLVPSAAAAGPTMADVHASLSKLLQEIETGSGDRLLNQLDREARSEPGAQALLRRYNSLVEGVHPIKLANVQFKAEPRDGRLVVTGKVLIQLPDPATPPRALAMQAEFASRAGTVVMTRLAQVQE